MDIDSDTLGIPETEYDARVTLPSSEFLRIVRDLSQLGESVRIEVSKEGVRFASDGESANGNVLLRPSGGAGVEKVSKVKINEAKEEDEEEEKKTKVKKEKTDEDVEMDEEAQENEEFKPESDGEEEAGDEEDSDEEGGKKRKKKVRCTPLSTSVSLIPFSQANASSGPSKRAKTASKGKGKKKDDESDDAVRIEMNQHVSLTFSLKYLVNFSKSASLSSTVQLMMSNDVPLLVRFVGLLSDLSTYNLVRRFPMSLDRATFDTIWPPRLEMNRLLH